MFIGIFIYDKVNDESLFIKKTNKIKLFINKNNYQIIYKYCPTINITN